MKIGQVEREEQVQNRRFISLYQSFPLTFSETTLLPPTSTGLHRRIEKNVSSGAAGGPGAMAGSSSV